MAFVPKGKEPGDEQLPEIVGESLRQAAEAGSGQRGDEGLPASEGVAEPGHPKATEHRGDAVRREHEPILFRHEACTFRVPLRANFGPIGNSFLVKLQK